MGSHKTMNFRSAKIVCTLGIRKIPNGFESRADASRNRLIVRACSHDPMREIEPRRKRHPGAHQPPIIPESLRSESGIQF